MLSIAFRGGPKSSGWCPHKKRTQRHTHGERMVQRQGWRQRRDPGRSWGHRKLEEVKKVPPLEALLAPRSQTCDPQTSERTHICFKSPGSWCFVAAGVGDEYRFSLQLEKNLFLPGSCWSPQDLGLLLPFPTLSSATPVFLLLPHTSPLHVLFHSFALPVADPLSLLRALCRYLSSGRPSFKGLLQITPHPTSHLPPPCHTHLPATYLPSCCQFNFRRDTAIV